MAITIFPPKAKAPGRYGLPTLYSRVHIAVNRDQKVGKYTFGGGSIP